MRKESPQDIAVEGIVKTVKNFSVVLLLLGCADHLPQHTYT